MSEVDVKETVDNEEVEKAPAEELVDMILAGELHAANQKFNSIVEAKVIEKIEEEKHKISQTLFAEDDDEEEEEGDDDDKKKKDEDEEEVDEAKAKVKEDDEEDGDDDDDSDDDDEDEDPVGDPKKADEGKIPPQFLKKGKGDDDDDDDSEEDDKDEKEPVDELSLKTVGAAAQKAADRVASGERRNVSGDGSKREKDFHKKSQRQSDKFSKYAQAKDTGGSDYSGKEKGVGSRTKDPKHKKELIDKASGKAAKAARNYARKREKEGTSGSVAYEETSPETSFDPGEASANVELPKGSFVAQVAAHLSGQRQ